MKQLSIKTEVLQEHHTKHDGNDCLIYNSVVLMHIGEQYFVLEYERKVGWFGVTDDCDTTAYEFESEARGYYNQCIEKQY